MKYLRGSAIFVVLASMSLAGQVHAQKLPDVDQAINDKLPNPFDGPVENWVKFEGDRKLGATIGLSFDSKGHLWAVDRCGGTSCENSTVAPIFEIDPKTGKVLRSFGGGLLVVPHDIFVDQNDHDNVWVSDQSASKGKDKGEQVWKFSPEGKVLLTLGKAGQKGDAPDTFNDPTSMVTGKNGDIFVSDGHNARGPVARIVKFDKTGKFIKVISHKGSGPGELSEPHSITIDKEGRLLVADRGNVRVSIFDQEGNFIAAWKQFGIPTQVYVDKKTDTLYVADNFIRPEAPDAHRGVRIGSAKTGKVQYFIEDPDQNPKEISLGPDAAKGDGKGTFYIGENDRKTIKKFTMKKK